MIEELDVDVANPGQVFACLGLLEALERLAPGTTGGFVEEARFLVESGASVCDAVAAVKSASLSVAAHDCGQALGDSTGP